ncbi:acyl carrier protein [Kitasatospora sp. NBC_01287]|uniref:acyl carrier protein n=1 Tax=Kitasatospora sp. NBC_01287 TaxID=2903573 RepID=UPI00225BFD11|nr:acyl carrier protein [Kitasatospora sp. NBC_01287]MCX4750331.1 acyl carrier protein [Kitasatospora sp. NBC_01287]
MTTSAHQSAAASAALLAEGGKPLQEWLLDRLSCYLERPALAIDPDVPLAEYGMDSVCALSLCGDLEEVFGLEVDQTLLWDHPTVRALLGFLAEELPKAAEERS